MGIISTLHKTKMKRLKHKFDWNLNEVRFRGLFAWLLWLWFIYRITVVLSSCSTTQPYSNLQITYPQLHNHLDDTVCVYVEETTVK